MPALGLAMYRLTIVMHDCVHGTLFQSRRANRVLGVVTGAVSGIEFHAFARLHSKHHRLLGRNDDPQGPDYLGVRASKAGTLWHLLRPLFGLNVIKLWQVAREVEKPALSRQKYLGHLLPVVAAQSCAALIASGGLAHWWLAPLPVASAATFGLFFAQLRAFAEHVALPGDRAEGCVRSHSPRMIDRLLLYDLNFNYHREHHLYPGAPSCHLPELHHRLVAERPQAFKLAPGMFATIGAALSGRAAASPAL
jgi:acyl-lipid omega-6 desaturase (Delta-12 desaturase)